MTTPDFNYQNGGSVYMITPVTARAKEWTEQNVNIESWQNKNQFAVEWRLFQDLAEGIREAGMLITES